MKVWILIWNPPESAGICPRPVGVYLDQTKAEKEAQAHKDREFAIEAFEINASASFGWPDKPEGPHRRLSDLDKP